MHKLLSSPEILEEIFSYSSQHTNTVTARVCRLWFRHSVRLLWKTAELNNILKVVSLFGDHTGDKSVNDISEQPILPKAWDRFFLYSKNICCLKCSDINYTALKPVMYWRPNMVELFSSRLTVVHWDGKGGQIKYFPFLLTSTLQRLYVSLDTIQEPMADALCQTIAARSPYLRHFQLIISSSTSDHGILSRPLGELMSHLTRLTVTVIPVRFMTPELFIILSRLSNLKVLLMLSSTPNFVDTDFVKTLMKQKLIDDETIKEFSPFHSLTDLFICDNNNSQNQTLMTFTVLNSGFQFLKLTHLVCSPFTKTLEEITGLMELVHSVCPILKIITIKRPSGSSTRIPWQAIQALLKCPRLRTLEVFNRTVDMELNDIRAVATNRSSWQNINLPSTQPLSYEALLYFAQNCPELGKLGLTLDNTAMELPDLSVNTSPNKTDILFSSLHTLNVGESPITSPVNIGIFLSQICGNTLKIISSEGGKYSQSWKTVSDIVDSMNSTARVRMLNKEVAGLRETVAGLKRLKRRINSPPQFKIKFKNES